MCLASFIGGFLGETSQKEKLLQSSWIKELLMSLRRCSGTVVQSYPRIQQLVFLFLTLLVKLRIEYRLRSFERKSWKFMETSWYHRDPLVTLFEVPILLELFLHYVLVQIDACSLLLFDLNSDWIFLVIGFHRFYSSVKSLMITSLA